jgi:hypothetical protein
VGPRGRTGTFRRAPARWPIDHAKSERTSNQVRPCTCGRCWGATAPALERYDGGRSRCAGTACKRTYRYHLGLLYPGSRPTAGWMGQRHSQPAPNKVPTKLAQARPPACEPGPVLPPPPPTSLPHPPRGAGQRNSSRQQEQEEPKRKSPLGHDQ